MLWSYIVIIKVPCFPNILQASVMKEVNNIETIKKTVTMKKKKTGFETLRNIAELPGHVTSILSFKMEHIWVSSIDVNEPRAYYTQ